MLNMLQPSSLQQFALFALRKTWCIALVHQVTRGSRAELDGSCSRSSVRFFHRAQFAEGLSEHGSTDSAAGCVGVWPDQGSNLGGSHEDLWGKAQNRFHKVIPAELCGMRGCWSDFEFGWQTAQLRRGRPLFFGTACFRRRPSQHAGSPKHVPGLAAKTAEWLLGRACGSWCFHRI